MMRFVERLPGGRWVILIAAALLFIVGSLIFSSPVVRQVADGVILVLSVAMLWTYRRSIPAFFTERKDAGIIWISLGIFTIVLTTVINTGHTAIYRVMNWTFDLDSRFISAIHFAYAFSFGCLFLVPLSVEEDIPLHGWRALATLVVLTSIFMLIITFFFGA